MTKAKVKRTTKDMLDDTVICNLVDVEKARRASLIIYGRPQSGKTLLSAYEAARLAKLYGGGVLIYTAEVNYVDNTVLSIKSIFGAFGVPYEVREVESVDHMCYELMKMRKDEEERRKEEGKDWVPEWRVVVVDSLNTIRILVENTLSYYQRRSVGKTAPVISQLERVAWTVSRYARAVDGWGILVNSGTAMINRLYRGLVPYKPSYGEKAVHHAVAEIWLGNPEDFPSNIRSKIKRLDKSVIGAKVAVLVSYREGGAGKGLVFEFERVKSPDGVEYVKPSPLFPVEFAYEEELV